MKRRMQSRNAARVMVAAALLLTQNACAVLGSTAETADNARQGIAYMLPKALLPVELVEADGVVMLRMRPAVLIGDPSQRYFLSHARSVFASDTLDVSVDETTGLLDKITVTTKDESLAVLSELVKLGRGLRIESGAPPGERILFVGLYDPDGETGPGTPNGRLLEGLQRTLLHWVDGDAKACGQPAEREKCRLAQRLQQALAEGVGTADPVVIVNATRLDRETSTQVSGTPLSAGRTAVRATDCSIGVCYRALQPFAVELAITEVSAQSTIVQLPNGGAPIALPLDRAPFVQTEHTIDFNNGQLKQLTTDRPSSALALVKWPLEVYQAVLEATSTLIQLRIGANTKEVELAQSELTTAKELESIREEWAKLKRESGTGTTSGGILGGPQRGDALLAVELGKRPVLSNLMPTDGAAGAPPAPDILPGQPK